MMFINTKGIKSKNYKEIHCKKNHEILVSEKNEINKLNELICYELAERV